MFSKCSDKIIFKILVVYNMLEKVGFGLDSCTEYRYTFVSFHGRYDQFALTVLGYFRLKIEL